MHSIALRLLIAAVAGGAVFAGLPASKATAADLVGYGGDCCADLEERIAELEATTARKGNRKVSLKISGWVNEGIFIWDDGLESNAYIGTNSQEQSRFKISGKAGITSDVSAGYTLEVGVSSSGSSGWSAATDEGGSGLVVRKSSWYLSSKTYGRVTVGQDGAATYHLIDDVINPVANTRYYADFESAGVGLAKFSTINEGAAVRNGFTWEQIMAGYNTETPGQNSRRNVVKYDSPKFGGFSFSAAWGEDDFFDTNVKYAGEFGSVIVSAVAGYGESTEGAGDFDCNSIDADCQWWGASAAVKHVPTGLYAWFGYGGNEVEDPLANGGAGADDTSNTYYVQSGIEKVWSPLGTTTIFGEYRKDEVGATAVVESSDLEHYGAGIVQAIDAAAMDLYAVFRRSEGSYDQGAGDIELEKFDLLIMGGRIKF